MPERATPLYNLVSFTNVPYAEAMQRGRALDDAVSRVVEGVPADSVKEMGAMAWLELVMARARGVLDGQVV